MLIKVKMKNDEHNISVLNVNEDVDMNQLPPVTIILNANGDKYTTLSDTGKEKILDLFRNEIGNYFEQAITKE